MTDLDAILDEIRQYNEAQFLQPGDFTRQAYMERFGVSDQTAQTEIGRAVKAGLVEDLGERVTVKGRWARAYRWKAK